MARRYGRTAKEAALNNTERKSIYKNSDYPWWAAYKFKQIEKQKENMGKDEWVVREKNQVKQEEAIEVSLIIPSYNKFPLNLLTLYSLEKQTFDHSKMEVVFIDDASTDQTQESLQNFQPAYSFQYIRCDQNVGRAKARNLGVRSARGKLLIFLDAEMITQPNFIEQHYNYHKNHDKLIVTGAMYYKSIYSCIFPEFSEEMLKDIAKKVSNQPVLKQRFRKFESSGDEYFLLLEKADIDSGLYQSLVTDKGTWYEQITNYYGEELEGFELPWPAFLTGNVSVQKNFIEEVGAFDEGFVKYGYEDWELGYRLHQAGAKYMLSKNVITYHQEHPVGADKWAEATHNYYLFTKKHPDIEVLSLGLELSRMADLPTINQIIYEYKLLSQRHQEEFNSIQHAFIELLKTIALLLKVDIRHFNLLGAAGFNSGTRKALLQELKQLKNVKEYGHLAKIMEKMIYS